MVRASGPERRTTPMPPRPGGVEMATMVSVSMLGAAHIDTGYCVVFFVMVGWACLLRLVRCRGGVLMVKLWYLVWLRWSGNNMLFRDRAVFQGIESFGIGIHKLSEVKM